MLAMITLTSAHRGSVSQLTGSAPNTPRAALTIPESLLSIQDQLEAETINGNSHGTRNRARSVAESGKFWRKNSASAIPMENWNTKHTTVKTTVCVSAGRNVGSAATVR